MSIVVPELKEGFVILTWGKLQKQFCEYSSCPDVACADCMFDTGNREEFKKYYEEFIGETDDKNGNTPKTVLG